ncbi:MAG: NADH-quinone oxidoreductase subunit C [Bacteroidota bacterium]
MPVHNQHSCKIRNNSAVDFSSIPVYTYAGFSEEVVGLMANKDNHYVIYFAFPVKDNLQFIAAIADDSTGEIALLSHILYAGEPKELESLTPRITALHIFEREIFENHGIYFKNHPWLKPVRYPYNRFNRNLQINDYPFYQIKSHELHEVGVGPIHAGIIEPGHFRFICNGEMVLHLEIQLGWQHRGLETLLLQNKKLLQRTILSESLTGDTAVGHSLAFVGLMEALGEIQISEQLMVERSIALELERIAIHVGDIAALCTDVAYSLGANIFGILRTGIINFTQSWCGNRLGKGMIRAGGINLPFTPDHKKRLLDVLSDFEFQFIELADRTYKLPSIENRFDNIGTLSEEVARNIGAVGMTARMANVNREIRASHPFAGFLMYPVEPVVLPGGDVYSRFLLRREEIESSVSWIRNVLSQQSFDHISEQPLADIKRKPNQLAISLTEGWRGEICHCTVSDETGELITYKIKDPSMHNWKALELSLRNLEISDFPINNKSYNLSYCGFDL